MKTNTDQTDTKQRLFKAAIQVFAEKGYEAATVRAICKRAEANVASINYHFGDKEKLYAQVVAEIFRASSLTRHQLLPRDAHPVDRLRAFIRASFEEILPSAYEYVDEEECTAMGTIFMMEMARPTKALDDIIEDYIRPDCDELDDIIDALAGFPVPDDQRGMLTGSVIGQVLHYYYSFPIISRMSEDGGAFRDTPEFLEIGTEHVLQFSLGGIERVTGCTIKTESKQS